ncbi:hypothetical protein TWF694_000644 [Orbilia ellipsospora]|uniref:Mitochondrial carrier n=1 Tax=Orbilia ellipsospora TaxID=2528407 RepID=A0AAV9XQM7_9PEZI
MNRYNHYNSDLDAFELYHLEAEELSNSTSSSTSESLRIEPPVEYNAVIAGLSGAIGTSISNVVVYPIDLIVKRLQVQRALSHVASQNEKSDEAQLYAGFIDAARRIHREEGGIGALYSGCLQDTTNSMSSAFLYFLSYNFIRQRRLQANISPSGKVPSTLGVFEEISVGVLAGAFAKFFTAPIANVVTRKQTAALHKGSNSTENTSDVKSILRDIYSEKGVQGFWSGYGATLILTLNPSITFLCYETSKRLLPKRYRDNPTAGQAFILAAISKAVASSIMYPMSLVKSRSQVQRKKRADSSGSGTVFDTLKEVYDAGGIMGFYEGFWGEIFKGFFSNGITMLFKEMLHRNILALYILIVRLQNRNKKLSL